MCHTEKYKSAPKVVSGEAYTPYVNRVIQPIKNLEMPALYFQQDVAKRKHLCHTYTKKQFSHIYLISAQNR